jgi:hypothetical protein
MSDVSHHLQKRIILALATTDELSFTLLRPDGVENKLFDYHLKKTISSGYVIKNSNGGYELTQSGKKLGIHVAEKINTITSDKTTQTTSAYSVLFLVVYDAHKGWLLYTRRNHPVRGLTGFMHVVPRSDESIFETASKHLTDKTGITASFVMKGSGYSRIFTKSGLLESFTNYTLLYADASLGDLKANDAYADYFWAKNPDWASKNMLPNMPSLVSNLCKEAAEGAFFLDENYTL